MTMSKDLTKYVKQEGSTEHRCRDCNDVIMAARVAHPIWIEGTCGGPGKCQYEVVPYCPKCEEEPSFHGSPIQVSMAEAMSL